MTKGGARTASAKKAVAKGMGIAVFFNVLEEIDKINDWVAVDTVMMNLHFGGERNETCRSYFKELWRYGLIDRKEGSKIVECTAENWKKGGRPLYRISKRGKELLGFPDKHRVFALAWLVVKADNEEDFEQLHNAFNTFKKREVPLSMFKASGITGVVRDSIKAIMYGWLEPLGFLDRTDNGTFKLNKEYYDLVNSFNSMKDVVPHNLPNQIVNEDLNIATISDLEPIAPETDRNVNIPFRIENKSKANVTLNLKCRVYPLFMNRFYSKELSQVLKLEPYERKKITISLNLKEEKISESFKRTELGSFEVNYNNKKSVGALPTLFLTTKSHLHEIKLANLLSEMGYPPITLTKSDRPDMIIFPARKEQNLEDFLHNEELKILVETTSVDILSLQKVEDDLSNFREHTTKVLKINAKRTLIVGKSLAGNIKENVSALLKKYHPFTIITLEDLEYLNQKIKQKKDNSWSKVGKILTYNGIVDRQLIDSIFR